VTSTPLTSQQLDDIEARHKAATPGPWGVYEFGGGSMIDIAAGLEDTGCGYRARREICRLEDEPLDNDPTHKEWTAEEDWTQVQADAAFIAHAPDDVRALLAEVRRLRTELEVVTEFRLPPAPPAYTPLIVRRDPAYDGTRWAVLHDPGDLAVRRTWTAEGWEMAWASSHDEIFCWPDAVSALAAAKQAQGEDDREPDLDGVGRTPESYRETAPQAADETHVVADGSDDPEHVDDCPGCPATDPPPDLPARTR